MPTPLRNGLWDVARIYFFDDEHIYGYAGDFSESFDVLSMQIWFRFYRIPLDERPSRPYDTRREIRERYFEARVHKVYEFLEFLARRGPKKKEVTDRFVDLCNSVLERERAAFRFADDTLIQITDEEQLKEVSTAIEQQSANSVSSHIRRAAEFYSANQPDYRNSIKESVSAVEAAVSFLSGKRPNGVTKSLRRVLDEHVLHPSLIQGFEKLYAYSSDANGVRHALLDDRRDVTQEDARYMLVSCSAFANYLLALSTRK